MITMDMLSKIRRMFFRDKLSLHEITKRTGFIAQHSTPMAASGGEASVAKFAISAEVGMLAKILLVAK